ncbi:MAG: methyltransferase domain-containing protein [Bryobacteraceae bacterium]
MAEFTGERVIPGEVNADLLNEHFARYAFAARLCRRKRVLDAGCGAGYGAAELARYASQVTGVDNANDAIVFATERYSLPNLTFQQADCTALPFADRAFDLVTAFEVIEHLEDWRGFLGEARRVLAQDGQLIVSTPNRLYYAESRKETGPNPFHVHEFEFDEFRGALEEVFPHVMLFVENHSEGVVFQPACADSGRAADVRVEGAAAPADSHFFVAVCAGRPQTGAPTFVYVPSTANILREREQHIGKLEEELATKDVWLEKAKGDLAALNDEHQELLAMFRQQQEDLEARNQWAARLNEELSQAGARVEQLQTELAAEQAAGREVAAGYEQQIAQLDAENRAKTQWALETERRLTAEVEERTQELVRSVELLHQTEAELDQRTAWAKALEEQVNQLDAQVAAVRASRWFQLGRRMGLGPDIRQEGV